MIAQLTTGQLVVYGIAVVIGCIVGAFVARWLEERSYLRRYKKWEKEADDDLL
jgi:uncharacterized membrane-anchored protein YhcB (DUF1043 family)